MHVHLPIAHPRRMLAKAMALALLVLTPTIVLADYWKTPFKADACVARGFRQYSSQLMGIVGSWEAACAAKPADIDGQHFDRPNRCVNNNGMWGEFDVRDATCDPQWASITPQACRQRGVRQYSGQLINIVGSWEDACAQMPATVADQYFDHPTRCVNSNGMWGEFDVRDVSCDPQWASITPQACRQRGVRQHSGQLINIVGSWEDACAQMPATVADQYFDHPTRCVNNNGMWGEFDVVDESCPHWGSFKQDACTDVGKRQYSSVLADIPEGADWNVACNAEGAVVAGQTFTAPTRCVATATAMWGEFDVDDSSCTPHWAAFAPESSCCVKLGVKRYTAQLLDVPDGVSWEHACAVTSATVNGQFFQTPSECRNGGIYGMFGYFDANDSSCFGSWGNFTSECAARGFRRFSANLLAPCGINRNEACPVTPANVQGVNFTKPDVCTSPNPGYAKGHFHLTDECCLPSDADTPSCAPPAQTPRIVAVNGLKYWPNDPTAYVPGTQFQFVVEHGWKNKIVLYADGDLVYGTDPNQPSHLTQSIETVSEDNSNLKMVSKITVSPPQTGFIEGKSIKLGISEESINPKYAGTPSQQALYETFVASVTKPCMVDIAAPETVNLLETYSVTWTAADCKQYEFSANGAVFERNTFAEIAGNAERMVSDTAVTSISVAAGGFNASGVPANKQKTVLAICQNTPNHSTVQFDFAVQGGFQCTTVTQLACTEDQAKKLVELIRPPPDWVVKPGVCQSFDVSTTCNDSCTSLQQWAVDQDAAIKAVKDRNPQCTVVAGRCA